MYLGLKCTCGHEINFPDKIFKMFMECNLEHMVIICYLCKSDVLLRRDKNKLFTHKLLSRNTEENSESNIIWDPNPISSCIISTKS